MTAPELDWARALQLAERVRTEGWDRAGDELVELETILPVLWEYPPSGPPDVRDICRLAGLLVDAGRTRLGAGLLRAIAPLYADDRPRYLAESALAAVELAAGDLDRAQAAADRAAAVRPDPRDPAAEVTLAEVRVTLRHRRGLPAHRQLAVLAAAIAEAGGRGVRIRLAARYAWLRYQSDRQSPDLNLHRAALIDLETAAQVLNATAGAEDRDAVRAAVTAAIGGFEYACRRGGAVAIRRADARLRDVTDRQVRSFGPNHPETVVTVISAAAARFEMARSLGSTDFAYAALTELARVAGHAARVLGVRHPQTMTAVVNAVTARLELIYVGRLDPALARAAAADLDRLASEASRVLGAEHATVTLVRRQAAIARALASSGPGREAASGGGLATITSTGTDPFPGRSTSFGDGRYAPAGRAGAQLERTPGTDPVGPGRSRRTSARPEDSMSRAVLLERVEGQGPGLVRATAFGTVGAKATFARRLGADGAIGVDLVANATNALVATAAEPRLVSVRAIIDPAEGDAIARIGSGVADGCEIASCRLELQVVAGGAHDYRLDATTVAEVAESKLLGGDRVEIGDVVVAFRSSGLHCAGYRLVMAELRHVDLTVPVDGLGGRTPADVLLTPTNSYVTACRTLAARVDLHALSPVTDGGIPRALARVLPYGADAVVDRSTWRPQPIFQLLASLIPRHEMEAVFNLGIGMVAILPRPSADRAIALLAAQGVEAWVAGEVVPGSGQGRMTG